MSEPSHEAQRDHVGERQPGRIPPSSGSSGFRLLDACFDDVAYTRYLLQSRLPADRSVRGKVNWKDQQSGNSILHCLSYSDMAQAVRLLLSNNADANTRNQNQETPLHWCAKMNSTSSAKALLDAGADLNAQDISGSTPLHYAALLGNVEMVMQLLEKGADVSLLDLDGKAPIDLAVEGKNSAAKATAVIFLRHYQRLGIVPPKLFKSKLNSMSSMISAPSVSNKERDSDVPESNPSRLTPPPVTASQPRTFIDELRDGNASSSFSIKRSTISLGTGASAAKTHPRRASSTSPPPFHFGTALSPPPASLVAAAAGAVDLTPKKAKPALSAPDANAPIRLSPPTSAQPPTPTSTQTATRSGVHHKSASLLLSLDNVANTSPAPMTRGISSSVLVLSSPTHAAPRLNTEKEIQEHVADITKKLFPNVTNGGSVLPATGGRLLTKDTPNAKSRRVLSASEAPTMTATAGAGGGNGPTGSDPASGGAAGGAGEAATGGDAVSFTKVFSPAGRQRTMLCEAAYPPADMLPFLPSLPSTSAGYLDVVVCIEHCFDCHLHSDQSLRHDPKKYVHASVSVLYAVLQALVVSRLKVRVFAMRCTPLTVRRLGALEVTMAVCVPSLDALPMTESLYNFGGFGGARSSEAGGGAGSEKKSMTLKPRWATHKLFSKLASKTWPAVKAMEQKAIGFLDVTLREVATTIRDNAGQLCDDAVKQMQSTGEPLHSLLFSDLRRTEWSDEMSGALEKTYKEWQERMKMPVQVVRDPLDVDIPSLFPTVKRQSSSRSIRSVEQVVEEEEVKHPQGPYLEKSLAEQLEIEDYNRVVLEHFFVFDAR